MSLGHEHGFVLIGLAGPMDVMNISLSLCNEVTILREKGTGDRWRFGLFPPIWRAASWVIFSFITISPDFRI